MDKELAAARDAGMMVDLVNQIPLNSFNSGPALRFFGQGQFDPMKVSKIRIDIDIDQIERIYIYILVLIALLFFIVVCYIIYILSIYLSV